MNGAHDLGGKHGFGPIDTSQQVNFAHEWEEQVFKLTLACGMLGQWNIDESRFAREDTDPAHYLTSSYYEHWLDGLERLLLEKGLVSEQELTERKADGKSTLSAVAAGQVPAILAAGGPTLLDTDRRAMFESGQRVVVIDDNPRTHTRAPGYVKGKTGTIIQHYGAHIFADEHARSAKKEPQYLYSVEFDAVDLWGRVTAQAPSVVRVDLFEPYLRAEPVT